jgi:phage shock protein PspC (stress-responsive transcriptional regulator)
MNDRLYRSRDDRMFAGVAGGVAERFDLDPSLVRVVWVVLMFLTGGLFFLLYVVMAIVVPEAPAGPDRWAAWSAGYPSGSAPAPAPGAVPGWGTGTGTGAGQPPSPVPTPAPTAGQPFVEVAPEGTSEETPPPPTALPGPPAPSGPPPWAVPPPRHEHRGGGAIIGGIFLVLLGAYFLVRSLAPDIELGPFWPVVLIVIGIALLIGSVRPGRGESGG